MLLLPALMPLRHPFAVSLWHKAAFIDSFCAWAPLCDKDTEKGSNALWCPNVLMSYGIREPGVSEPECLSLTTRRERLLTPGRSDILELDQEDVLQVRASPGTRLANPNLMGLLLRPRLFITPGTTM